MIETIIGLTMEKFKPIEYHDFVDKDYQEAIYKHVTDIKFNWHFMEDPTTERINTFQVSTPSFGNLIYWEKTENNDPIDFWLPVLDAIEDKFNLKITKLLRMRLGFLMNTRYAMSSQPYRHNEPHVDYDQEHYTLVYYVNESDGDTIIFNETEKAEKYYPMHKCMPQRGKALLFNGKHYHASTCPKIHTKRIVLTVNFIAHKV